MPQASPRSQALPGHSFRFLLSACALTLSSMHVPSTHGIICSLHCPDPGDERTSRRFVCHFGGHIILYHAHRYFLSISPGGKGSPTGPTGEAISDLAGRDDIPIPIMFACPCDQRVLETLMRDVLKRKTSYGYYVKSIRTDVAVLL